MITSAHSRKANAVEFIAGMHMQYHIGRNTNGSEKKHQKIDNANDGGHETSLAEVGDFKQQCYSCGQVGHRRNVCPNKKQGGTSRGSGSHGKGSSNINKGNCNHCGFKCHVKAKCWRKHPELRLDKSGACIEILVASVEDIGIEKDQPSFTDFKFINENPDLNEENVTVA